MFVLRIYNTLSKRVEEFKSSEEGVVKAYFCGPTPYDHTHIGHARAYVAFDFLKRHIMSKGYNFIHVQNITDIDDKIINRAREENKSWREIADYYTREYIELMKELNIRIDFHPRVTDHISDIIEFIQKLIDKGHAYVAPSGSVYFDVSTYKDYGRLSGRAFQEEWRQEEEFLAEKKNPYDFALWKAAKPGEPYWESPWGKGRPGWHIECSVMSSKYLGSEIDIHGGGQDLIFPHHENERAQSESYFGKSPWVRYWVHIGYLTISGEKMSKSLGNIILLREALQKWGAPVIRLWIFSAHYRKTLDYKEESLEQAKNLYKRVREARDLLIRIIRDKPLEHSLSDKDLAMWRSIDHLWIGFEEALDNDLNTPEAMVYFNKLISLIYSEIINRESSSIALKALNILEKMDHVLGILPAREELKISPEEIEDWIKLIIEIRKRLRKKRLYEESDWIREELLKRGVKVFDSKEDTLWIKE
ncbi:MAG: cysteine--tRNA ligase [Sulfolobales archaeon]